MKVDFKNTEKLYRGVKRKPKFIKRDNTITRNCFKYTGKNSNGCSFFRQMDRENDDAVKDCLEQLKGVIDFTVSITYNSCMDANIYVEHTPSHNSKYHSELFQNKEKDKLNDDQLDFLASNCKIEKNME